MKYIKYMPWLIVIIAVGFVAVYQWQAARAAAALLSVKNKELMQANLELGRAETKIAEQKDIYRLALKEIDTKWKQEIKERQALITMYAQLEARYEAEKKKVKVRTRIVYKDKPVTVDLPKNKIFVREDNGEYKQLDSIQWSYKDFRITMSGDALQETLTYKLHQKFAGKLVETKLPTDGRNYYFELYELDDKDKKVGKLKLDNFQVLKAKENPERMHWWDPKLDLKIGFGMTHTLKFSMLGEVGLSASGYGKTLDDLRWRFFRIGMGTNGKDFSLSFTPALYNIGKNLPLISNFYLSLYGGYYFKAREAHFGVGTSLVF